MVQPHAQSKKQENKKRMGVLECWSVFMCVWVGDDKILKNGVGNSLGFSLDALVILKSRWHSKYYGVWRCLIIWHPLYIFNFDKPLVLEKRVDLFYLPQNELIACYQGTIYSVLRILFIEHVKFVGICPSVFLYLWLISWNCIIIFSKFWHGTRNP